MTNTGREGEFDSMFYALQWNGRYQIVQLVLLMLAAIPLSFNMLSIVFLGYHVTPTCRGPNTSSLMDDVRLDVNVTGVNVTHTGCGLQLTRNHTLLVQLPCGGGYEYPHPRDRSLASDWDLVCGKEPLVDLLQTLYAVGNGLGSVGFAVLADKYGRKFAHILAGIILLTTASSMSFVPSYTAYAVLKIVQGASHMGIRLSGVALSFEIVPTERRHIIGTLNGLCWGFSLSAYAVTAYFMRNISWCYHQLIIGLTAVYFVLLPWLLDESSRWLKAKDKFAAIERIMRKASRMNGKDEKQILALLKENIQTSTKSGEYFIQDTPDEKADVSLIAQQSKQMTNKEKSLLRIFKDRQILGVSAVVWFMWFVNGSAYLGLNLISTTFHSDKYIGFGLNAVMEIISAIVFSLTVERFGRKKVFVVFHLLSGSSLVMSVVLGHFKDQMQSLSIGVTIMSLIGKFAVTVSFNVLWFYTPEMYPTTIRDEPRSEKDGYMFARKHKPIHSDVGNVGFGLASLSARIGSLSAPFTRSLYQLYPWAPGTIFGSLCIFVTLLIRVLPETGGCELAQTVEEMKIMISNKGLARNKTDEEKKLEQSERL